MRALAVSIISLLGSAVVAQEPPAPPPIVPFEWRNVVRVGPQSYAGCASFNAVISGQVPKGTPVCGDTLPGGGIYNTGLFNRDIPAGGAVAIDLSHFGQTWAKCWAWGMNIGFTWVMPSLIVIVAVALGINFVMRLLERV